MPRRFRVPALALIPLVLASCSQELAAPKAPERTGLFTLNTGLGPVDVLAFRDDPAGSREVRIHAVLPGGGHAVRTIHIALEPAPVAGDASRIVQTVDTEGVERLRVLRTAEESGGFQTVFEIGGERMRLLVEPEQGRILFRVFLERDGVERIWERRLDPRRGRDEAYVTEVRESLRAFYGEGPLAGNQDLALLVAVEESPDWAEYMVEAPPDADGTDPVTERRIQQVCVGAAVAAKISCFVSRFTPWGMVVCVPATGISLACLAYHVVQVTRAPAPLPCNPGCPCAT